MLEKKKVEEKKKGEKYNKKHQTQPQILQLIYSITVKGVNLIHPIRPTHPPPRKKKRRKDNLRKDTRHNY